MTERTNAVRYPQTPKEAWHPFPQTGYGVSSLFILPETVSGGVSDNIRAGSQLCANASSFPPQRANHGRSASPDGERSLIENIYKMPRWADCACHQRSPFHRDMRTTLTTCAMRVPLAPGPLRSGPAISAENAQSINHGIYTTTIYCICQSVKKHILCSVSSKGEGFHCRHKPTKELKRSIPFFPNESSHGSLLTFDQNVFYVKFYFPIKFINICAVCARVANPCGSRIPPPLPLIMPFSMAQRRASAA